MASIRGTCNRLWRYSCEAYSWLLFGIIISLRRSCIFFYSLLLLLHATWPSEYTNTHTDMGHDVGHSGQKPGDSVVAFVPHRCCCNWSSSPLSLIFSCSQSLSPCNMGIFLAPLLLACQSKHRGYKFFLPETYRYMCMCQYQCTDFYSLTEKGNQITDPNNRVIASGN
jgi:hypothetical protein